ncbi:hypothetical protein ACIOMM_36420 [Streptomyces sp. NPDC087908]|uniref:hypothetical protein n=1 Tax=Streptomyces sp. NPDC087908 TaxID=3365820 RepID=UPI003803A324
MSNRKFFMRYSGAAGLLAVGALGVSMAVAAPSQADTADWRTVTATSTTQNSKTASATVTCPIGFSPVSFTQEMQDTAEALHDLPGAREKRYPMVHDTERIVSGWANAFRSLKITWHNPTVAETHKYKMKVTLLCGKGGF